MTEQPEEPTFRLVTVTCETDGCANAGHAIPLHVADEPNPAVVCGVCGQPITDIT